MHTPTWAIVPFLCYLFLIAVLPIFFGHFWEKNRNKLAVGLVAALPVLGYVLFGRSDGGILLLDTAREYVAFICLLGALFITTSGIYLSGTLVGSTAVNVVLLGVGAVAASVIGTTGASALMIRPLLRANEGRTHLRHVVIFFIFIVSNAAGLLTPLGDPPLFLGFLRGVPFTWTFRLFPQWLVVVGVLLALFAWMDTVMRKRDARNVVNTPWPVSTHREPLRIEGGLNLVWLAGIVATVGLVGQFGPTGEHGSALRSVIQIVAMVALGVASYKTTSRETHEKNKFSAAPILEVAAVFVGVFLTMVPALSFLEERGAGLGVLRPWQFFWASGLLSSVLDNAPTYLTFASLATGVVDNGAGVMSPTNLGALAAHPVGQHLLTAVSCGAVFMGAVTYIGNGPNFMVKAIAEQNHVRMPGFFGYTLWSFAILIPLFVVVTLIFF